ncbi:hypothetical protein EDB84DRAFT_1443498 [Lactarius hengduanensis]|nr:hypothetical protein EDB84DRAFT_1443498 [Lactarius hengduanensis]
MESVVLSTRKGEGQATGWKYTPKCSHEGGDWRGKIMPLYSMGARSGSAYRSCHKAAVQAWGVRRRQRGRCRGDRVVAVSCTSGWLVAEVGFGAVEAGLSCGSVLVSSSARRWRWRGQVGAVKAAAAACRDDGGRGGDSGHDKTAAELLGGGVVVVSKQRRRGGIGLRVTAVARWHGVLKGGEAAGAGAGVLR